jgi:hypothetical protein
MQAQLNFPKYCDPVLKGEIEMNDVSKLWRHITPHLRSSLAQLYLRTASRYICFVISFVSYLLQILHYILWTVFTPNSFPEVTLYPIYYEQFLPQTAFLKSPFIVYIMNSFYPKQLSWSHIVLYILWTVFTPNCFPEVTLYPVYYEQFLPQTAFLKSPCILYIMNSFYPWTVFTPNSFPEVTLYLL